MTKFPSMVQTQSPLKGSAWTLEALSPAEAKAAYRY